MHKMLLSATLAGAAFLAASPAIAADELIFVSNAQEYAADEPRWVVCYRWDQSKNLTYVSNIRRSTYGETKAELTWGDFIEKNYEVSDRLYGGCNIEETEKDAKWRYNEFRKQNPRFPKTLVEVDWTGPIAKPKSAKQGSQRPQAKKVEKTVQAPEQSGPMAAEIAAEKRRAVEERNRAAQKKYEVELAEQKRKVEEFERAKAEVERKKQEQRAAADRALAEHNAKLAAHAETLRQHEAALAQHRAEVEGAKEKILADFDKRQAAGEASTDTDANRCVSGAEIRYNSGFKGNTAATVSNGCDTKADIQICLKVDARWNCGLRIGVLPRNSYTHAAPGGTGEVRVDARVTGSDRHLTTPE